MVKKMKLKLEDVGFFRDQGFPKSLAACGRFLQEWLEYIGSYAGALILGNRQNLLIERFWVQGWECGFRVSRLTQSNMDGLRHNWCELHLSSIMANRSRRKGFYPQIH